MPVEWSGGWLLNQMVLLDTNPDKWWNEGGRVGFIDDDDLGWDPFAEAGVEPPPGWQTLPMHKEVSGGEQATSLDG